MPPQLRRLRDKTLGWLGGKKRAHVILVLAAMLGLSNADLGAVGAMAEILQSEFGIGRTQLGLLLTVSSGATAATLLIYGWLVDLFQRTRVLAVSVFAWGAAMFAAGAANSYGWLLIARVAMGAAAGAVLPATASLIGDFFSERERGRVYGQVLVGEIAGSGLGLIVSGEAARVWWRLGFWLLAPAAVLVGRAIWRLPEPERGGASRIPAEQEPVGGAGVHGVAPRWPMDENGPLSERLDGSGRVARLMPREHLVCAEDPQNKSIWWAAAYVLRIPTYLVLIVASATFYFFFAGVRTFGLEFMEERYGLGHSTGLAVFLGLGVGAVPGVYVGGSAADSLVRRGHATGRVWVTAIASLACASLYLIGALFRIVSVSGASYLAAGFCLGAISPALDAARLDITHGGLWGRAESVNATVRSIAEAFAPILFGYLAAQAFGGGPSGLTSTFLLMSSALFAGALFSLVAVRTYLTDVVTARAYERRTGRRP